MADNIFVGSVSVGVVPDLRGFNDRMRAELIPAANRIGQDMGKELVKGVTSSLNFGDIFTKSSVKGMPAVRVVGEKVGKEFVTGFTKSLDISKIITDRSLKARPTADREGYTLGKAYGEAFKRGFEFSTRGMPKPKVDLDMTRARLQIDALKLKLDNAMKAGGPSLSQTALRALLAGGAGGGGGGGRTIAGGAAGASGGGGGVVGGIGALIRALPGGTSGSIGAVPGPVLAGAGGLAALLAPFIAQAVAGFIPLLGGGAIAGLGVAGAFGAGGTTQQQVAQARAAAQAANARVRAAQARLAGLGGGGATPLATTAAQDQLAAAQARLQTARGGTSASAILSAEASVASAQDRINKLRGTGKATTAQLASAEASLASARATQSKASQAYQKAQADQITANQQRVRDSFKNLVQDAQSSLTQIGAPMAPVMKKIFDTADKTMKSLTPVFANAVGILAGPFQTFADTIIKSFADPQVTSSITAISGAFSDVLVAFTPDIPGIMNSFADAIERVAGAVSKNPKAFADFLNFVFQVGIFIINMIADLTDAADWIEKNWDWIKWIVIPEILAIQLAIKYIIKFRHDIAHWFDDIRHYVANQWDLMWQDTVGNTIRANRHLEQLISDWFHNIAHWFDIGRHWVSSTWDAMYQDTIGAAIRQQRHLEQLISDYLHNVANAFDVARHAVASAWDDMWNNTVGRAVHGWQDLYNKVWVPVRNFFTITLPGWIDSAVKSIGRLWDNIKGTIARPIDWVGKNILAHLFNAIDDITKFVGLKTPLQNSANMLSNLPTAATGGRITQGTGPTADDVLIRASRDETIVSAAHSKLPYMQAAFALAGVPGYAVGGLVNPVGPGAIPERVDMGVDYGGLFDLFAIGSGRITSISNSGWPGGTFIDLQLNPPYGSGYWYYAENIQPTVNVGDTVRAGQRVGIARGYGPGTEIGWASGRGGETAAAAAGQQNKHGDPGEFPTAWGVAASNLIKSLGGPPGIISGKISGGTAGIGGIVRTVGDILGGIGHYASVAISLASGNVTKALSDMLGKIGHGAGGATGLLGQVLTSLPGTLAGKALSFLVNKVKGFVKSQQSVSGVAPASGSGVQRWRPVVLQALALEHLPASLADLVLYQMQTESGGDPRSINLTDINAQQGDPSKGLMQVIGATFRQWHWPGTSNDIYDPLANIAAALNYAEHGRGFGRGPGQIGSGHGYARGTDGAAAGWAWVGEQGPELVHFHGGEMVMPHGSFGGYQGGTASAAAALAARNKSAAAALAAQNKATAAAIAAYNRMARAGASLAAAIAKITPKTTASVFASDQAKFLADLRLYFTPSVAKARSQLVIRQITEMQNLQTHMKTLTTSIANATAFQQQELTHLQSTGGIGAIGIQGTGAAGGRSILSGLTRQLTSMRNFGYAIRDLSRAGASQAVLKTVAAMDPAGGTTYARTMISALKKMHSLNLPPEMINQLIALGPDAALAYANAMQAAGPSVVRQIKSTEAALAATTLGTSRGIASVVSGGAYNTGANFVAGLKSQQSSLDAQFKHLGKTLGQEAIKWMHVPANQRPYGYQHGGWINEPISGYGAYSGAFYTFAEKGREYVLPEGQMRERGAQGDSYHAHFDGLTGAAIEGHVRVAFQAMSLQQGRLQRQGRRF